MRTSIGGMRKTSSHVPKVWPSTLSSAIGILPEEIENLQERFRFSPFQSCLLQYTTHLPRASDNFCNRSRQTSSNVSSSTIDKADFVDNVPEKRNTSRQDRKGRSKNLQQPQTDSTLFLTGNTAEKLVHCRSHFRCCTTCWPLTQKPRIKPRVRMKVIPKRFILPTLV